MPPAPPSRSTSRPEAIAPMVVSARDRGYADTDVRLRHLTLRPEQRRDLGTSPTPRLLVLGDGRGHALGSDLVPGDVAVVPPGVPLQLAAGPEGLDVFEARLDTVGSSCGPARVEPRVPLGPFHAELIVAPSRDPLRLGDVLSLAEIWVPPRVTTASHRLGVDERYLILGEPATMRLGDQSLPTRRGDVVAIPAGVLQCIRNDSPAEPLRLYCLCTPPFSLPTYQAGPVPGSGPPGFSLDAWWHAHRTDLESTP